MNELVSTIVSQFHQEVSQKSLSKESVKPVVEIPEESDFLDLRRTNKGGTYRLRLIGEPDKPKHSFVKWNEYGFRISDLKNVKLGRSPSDLGLEDEIELFCNGIRERLKRDQSEKAKDLRKRINQMEWSYQAVIAYIVHSPNANDIGKVRPIKYRTTRKQNGEPVSRIFKAIREGISDAETRSRMFDLSDNGLNLYVKVINRQGRLYFAEIEEECPPLELSSEDIERIAKCAEAIDLEALIPPVHPKEQTRKSLDKILKNIDKELA